MWITGLEHVKFSIYIALSHPSIDLHDLLSSIKNFSFFRPQRKNLREFGKSENTPPRLLLHCILTI